MSENRGPGALATSVTVTCVAAAIVLIRLWIRIRIVRASGWDDWMITIACVSSLMRGDWSMITDSCRLVLLE